MNETLLLYRCFKISCIYIYIEIDTKIWYQNPTFFDDFSSILFQDDLSRCVSSSEDIACWQIMASLSNAFSRHIWTRNWPNPNMPLTSGSCTPRRSCRQVRKGTLFAGVYMSAATIVDSNLVRDYWIPQWACAECLSLHDVSFSQRRGQSCRSRILVAALGFSFTLWLLTIQIVLRRHNVKTWRTW